MKFEFARIFTLLNWAGHHQVHIASCCASRVPSDSDTWPPCSRRRTRVQKRSMLDYETIRNTIKPFTLASNVRPVGSSPLSVRLAASSAAAIERSANSSVSMHGVDNNCSTSSEPPRSCCMELVFVVGGDTGQRSTRLGRSSLTLTLKGVQPLRQQTVDCIRVLWIVTGAIDGMHRQSYGTDCEC